MFNLIANWCYEYYWLPNVIGFVASFYMADKDPQSRVKTLICVQFWVILFVSEVLSAISGVMTEDAVVAMVTPMAFISSLIQVPIVAWMASKYPDSDRAVVLIVATIVVVICNALLILDSEVGTRTIWPLYNQVMFIISCLAIGSCNKSFSHGFAGLVFGHSGSRRSSFRRSMVNRAIKA